MEQLTKAAEEVVVSVKGTENSSSKEDTSGTPSKNALKKAAKDAEKAKKKAETAAKVAAQKAAMQEDSVDFSQGKYGVFPLIQSTTRSGTGSFLSLLIHLLT